MAVVVPGDSIGFVTMSIRHIWCAKRAKDDCCATNKSMNTIKDKNQGVKNFTSVTHWSMRGEIEAI